jgi:APA family basic amino acid/polyamine antiporter
MATLAKKLRTLDYFTLSFGTMVGVGWLVVMDDWLSRGGPLGGVLGFALGGLALVPIGYVYGRLAMAMPDSASEIAYSGAVFPEAVSFFTGWMMVLAYAIVCPWEAVAIGKIAAYIFPWLDRIELYRVGGDPVYLPHLLLGLGLVAVLTWLNWRGIRSSATFQNWMTFGLFACFALFGTLGVARGKAANWHPLFSHSGWVSVLLVLQIVPYFMTGFEAVPKCAEEAAPDFRSRGFFRAILLAIGVGTVFYVAVIAIVAYVGHWPTLVKENFATAVAFQRALGSRWIVSVIFAAALVSLVKVFNGNFVAASRLVFALGRRGMLAKKLGEVHPERRTPAAAILGLGVVSAAAVLLGEAILVPITEVGSLASATGWLVTCLAYLAMRPGRRQSAIAGTGAVVALALIGMKLVPAVPGHFSGEEYVALGLWVLAGLALRRRSGAA